MSFQRRVRSNLRLPEFRKPPPDFLRGPVARAAGVTLLTFFIGYFMAATWLFPAAEDPTDATFVDVPDLAGVERSEAEATLSELGLSARVRGAIHHPSLVSGTVIGQAPLPEQVARPGDTVSLTLSSGPEARVVPDMRGLTGPEAARLLRALGFDVEIAERREPGAGAGVIETVPSFGTRVYMPAEVRLVVGEGAPIVDVPDLGGRHVDDIVTVLEDAQLQLGATRYQIDAPQAPGRVVSQSPAAGSALRAGGFVSVVVAGTPPDSIAADLADEDLPRLPGDSLPGGPPRRR